MQDACDLPLCLDSSIIEVLEAGLAVYQGKALVNSVTAEDERLDAILPLVKRHGAAIIALPNDEEEIPEDPRRRLELARKIIDVATGKYGIPIEDIVIDPLAMPVGADTALVCQDAGDDRAAARRVRREHDARRVQRVLRDAGPRRRSAPRSCRWRSAGGLTSAIMDARSPQLVRSVKAADLLLDRDSWGAAWIAAHRAQAQARPSAQAAQQAAATQR